MYDEESLPKGMKKMPEEFADHSNVEATPINHQEFNYSGIIREAFDGLKKEGLAIEVLKLEIVEQNDAPTIVSVIMNVREAE